MKTFVRGGTKKHYVTVNPDATKDEPDKQIQRIKNGLKNAYGK